MPVKVYTMPGCPYCVRATRLLTTRQIAFEEEEVPREDHVARDRLMQLSGMKTMPQIFVNGQCIGGYTDLATLDQKDGLKSLAQELRQAPSAPNSTCS